MLNVLNLWCKLYVVNHIIFFDKEICLLAHINLVLELHETVFIRVLKLEEF